MSESWKDDCLEYDPFDGDFGVPGDIVLRDKVVKARKDFKCSMCCQGMSKGTMKRAIAAKFDGQLMSYDYCQECCEAMAREVLRADSDECCEPGFETEARIEIGRKLEA